jgi:hypothetical protein
MAAIYPRLFDGYPGYCCHGDPAATAGPVSWSATAWFVGIIVLSAAGLVAVRGSHQRFAVGACVGVVVAFVLMYVGLLDYGSMRFLLPVIGLLAIPVATALVAAVVTAPRRTSALVALGCVGVVAAHLALQINQGLTIRSRSLDHRRVDLNYAAQTSRYVQHRPCLVVAPNAQVIAYYLRCHIVEPVPTATLPAVAEAVSSGWSVIAIPRSRRLRGDYRFIKQQAWARHRVHIAGAGRGYVFVAPTVGGTGG